MQLWMSPGHILCMRVWPCPRWLTCKTYLAQCSLCTHACTHDRVVDELIMPLRRAACEPSHGCSFLSLFSRTRWGILLACSTTWWSMWETGWERWTGTLWVRCFVRSECGEVGRLKSRLFCAFQENVSLDSNTHSFSSSSITTYSKVGNEPPKVFQASSSTRCAPGGVRTSHVCTNHNIVFMFFLRSLFFPLLQALP